MQVHLLVNGKPLDFDDTSMNLAGREFLYSKMDNIAHRSGEKPAFLFDYDGKRLALSYDSQNKDTLMKTFQQIVAIKKKLEEEARQAEEELITPLEEPKEEEADFSMFDNFEVPKTSEGHCNEPDDECTSPETEHKLNNLKKDKNVLKKNKKRKKWPVVVMIIAVVLIVFALIPTDDTNNQKQIASNNSSESVTAQKETEPDVPWEYTSALEKAQSYSDTMYMSKQGIYDQLTSEYGEQFSDEAAQYAVDNLKANYKKNALEKARQYKESMNMSPEAIRDQLTSDYGEKFTQEQADWAISQL